MGAFLSILGFIFLLIILKFVYDTYLTNNTEKRWEDHIKYNREDAEYFERKFPQSSGNSSSVDMQVTRVITEKLFSISQTIFPKLIDLSNPHRKKAWAEEYLLCLRQFMIMAEDYKEFHSERFIIQLYNAVNTTMKHRIGIEISSDSELEFIQDKVAFYNEEVNNIILTNRNKESYLPFKLLYSLYINPLTTVKNVEDRAEDHFANNVPSYMIQYKVFLDNYPQIITEVDKILKSYKK